MNNFEFISPTKLYFGKKQEERIGEIISSYGFSSVLFVYGQNSIKRIGLYDKVIHSLNEHHIEYVELGGILPNPDIEDVKKGLDLVKKNNLELILCVGGGSVIDTGKLIANAYYYDGDPFDISLKKYLPTRALPLGVILTNSASGSELSDSCVISSRTLNLKRGYNNVTNRPLFAIENPELTLSLPLRLTGEGVVDILSHTFERFFCESSEEELCDYLAIGVMKNIIANGRIIAKDLNNYEARANIMLCSSLSHNGLTSLGKDMKMPIHQLEHELSGFFPNISHGQGLAILIPAWMKVCYKSDEEKFIKFAEDVMLIDKNLENNDKIELAIKELQEFFKLFELPLYLKDYGIKDEDIEKMSLSLTNNRTKVFPSHIPLDYNLALKVYKQAKEQ